MCNKVPCCQSCSLSVSLRCLLLSPAPSLPLYLPITFNPSKPPDRETAASVLKLASIRKKNQKKKQPITGACSRFLVGQQCHSDFWGHTVRCVFAYSLCIVCFLHCVAPKHCWCLKMIFSLPKCNQPNRIDWSLWQDVNFIFLNIALHVACKFP